MPLSGSDVSRPILVEYGRVRPRCVRSGAAGAAGPPEIAPESVGAGPVAGLRQFSRRVGYLTFLELTGFAGWWVGKLSKRPIRAHAGQ